VRDRAGTEKKAAAELGRSNVFFVQADINDYQSLKV
jgi:hypothetical protein